MYPSILRYFYSLFLIYIYDIIYFFYNSKNFIKNTNLKILYLYMYVYNIFDEVDLKNDV